jgi:hypothetical protein
MTGINKNSDKRLQMNGFNNRLDEAMKKGLYNQSSLSRKIQVTQPLIHYWLKGTDFPRKYHAQKAAWGLRVSYKWLVKGTGNPKSFKLYPINEFWTDISERLAYLIWVRGINTFKLGIPGIGTTTVSYWLDKVREPSSKHIPLLTEYFNCSENWLLHGSENLYDQRMETEYMDWVLINYRELFGVDLTQDEVREFLFS